MKARSRDLITWLLLAALLAAAVLAACTGASSMGALSARYAARLHRQWEQTENGAYRYTLPENGGGEAQVFLIKTYMRGFTLYLDDEELYSYMSDNSDRSYHMVTLPRDAGGKAIVLQRLYAAGMGSGAFRLGNAYLGTGDAVYISLLQDNLYALVFMLLALLSAGILIAVSVHLGRQWRGAVQAGLLYLGLFILDAGIWVTTDSDLLFFLTGRIEVISLISFVSFLVMPVFLLQFIQHMFYEMPLLKLLCRLFLLLTAAYLVNALFTLVSSQFVLLPCHLLIVCALAAILSSGVRRLRDKQDRQVKNVMAGVLLLGAFVIAALIRFYMSPLSNYAYFYCIGIVLFAACLVNAAFLRLYEQVEETANAEAYKRLAYTDILTGLENRTAYTEALRTAEAISCLSCVVLDINHLKWINDNWGHQAGDLSIITAANFIRDAFGALGTCYRIGGDEFVVLVRDRPAEQINAGLEKLRASMTAEKRASDSPFDIAAGCAVRRAGETVAQMIHRADTRMYKEKQRMKEEVLPF